LDQDGPAPDDAERARKRYLTLGRQQPDGMTPVTGLLDPEGRATWEPIFAKHAAPGMGNPAPRVRRVGSRSNATPAVMGSAATTRSSPSAATP